MRRLGRSFARIKVRAASFIKAAADFRKAKNEQRDDDRANHERDQTVRADERENFRRQAENSRADDSVDRDRYQVPAANAANQSASVVSADTFVTALLIIEYRSLTQSFIIYVHGTFKIMNRKELTSFLAVVIGLVAFLPGRRQRRRKLSSRKSSAARSLQSLVDEAAARRRSKSLPTKNSRRSNFRSR